DVLGQVHLSHAAFADAAHDVIAAGEDGAHEIAAFRRAQRRAIARAEALLEVVGLTALRTGLGGGVHVIDGALVGSGGTRRRAATVRPRREESTTDNRG